MKKKTTFLFFLSSFSLHSAVLTINTSEGGSFEFDVSSSPSAINCNGFLVNLSGESVPEINFNSTPSECPKIVIDNLVYQDAITINVYHENRLLVLNNSTLTNCLNSQGNPPTIGFGFIMSAGDLTSGIQSIDLNESNWTLEVVTVDSDVVCDGGLPYIIDEIFLNGFEGEIIVNPDVIFMNGFEG